MTLHQPLECSLPGTERHTCGRRRRQHGQTIVLFAMSVIVLLGLSALVIDMSWYWINTLRVQRAADAAALAGVVYLPAQASQGVAASQSEASRNGYTNNVAGAQVRAQQDSSMATQMDVTVSAPVQTFFMRIFGINSLTAIRTGKAQFQLPVPMGSPLNVFGMPTAKDLNGNSLNFWGAIQGTNTAKENGDPYATKVMYVDDSGVTNPQYIVPSTGDPGAYNYGIEVAPGTGAITISLYDPEFCARQSQYDDTGEIGNLYPGGGGESINTTFTLYAPSSTPYNYADDTQLAQFAYPGYDPSTGVGNPSACGSQWVHWDYSLGDYVGNWITYYTINTPTPGIYRLNVGTSLVGNVTNEFAIKAVATSGTQPQVYGLGAMSIYANMNTGTTNLYLAQIDATSAGKTAEIRLFDPGDAQGNASMQVMIPTASGYTPAQYRYYDAGVNGNLTPTPSALTTSPLVTTYYGNRYYNGHWVVIDAVIPPDYTAPQNGWWKIKYTYSGGAAHDRTTWQVNIIGNPVHLVVP